VLQSRTRVPQTGIENLVQAVGEVAQPIAASGATEGRHGMVLVRGELWRATATMAIPKGTRVRIVRVDGLTIQVEPVDAVSRP
jgi:membrane-bound ClpP family serine protease